MKSDCFCIYTFCFVNCYFELSAFAFSKKKWKTICWYVETLGCHATAIKQRFSKKSAKRQQNYIIINVLTRCSSPPQGNNDYNAIKQSII